MNLGLLKAANYFIIIIACSISINLLLLNIQGVNNYYFVSVLLTMFLRIRQN